MRHRTSGSSDLALVATFLPRVMAAPRADDAEWQTLHHDVAVATDGWGLDDWSRLRLHDRIALWLTAEGRRSDLTAALVHRSEFGPGFVCAGDPLMAEVDYATGFSAPLPPGLLVPHERDLSLVHRLTATPTDGGYVIKGHAYIRGLSFQPGRDHVHMWAGGRAVTVDQVRDLGIDATSGDGACSHADSGIRAVIKKPTSLAVEVTVQGVTRRIDRLLVTAPPKNHPLVTMVDADGADLVVSGQVNKLGKKATHLRMRSALHTVVANLSVVGSTFVGRLSLSDANGSHRPLPAGDYSVELAELDGTPISLWAGGELPAELAADGVVVQPAYALDGLHITLRSPLPLEVRGRLGQRRLISDVWSRPAQRSHRIVATCFGGKTTGDSVEPVVRALQERLPSHEVLWGVSDFSVPVADGFKPVLMHSREWHEALRDAHVLVNNGHFPPYYRHQGGQVYVQTWHGTPLKRIGNDMPRGALSLSYRATMAREAQAWSILLAQSPWAGQVLSTAFGYSGPVADLGYPRNDALLSSEAAEHRLRVRSELGLDAEDLAVLYAPTWRDDIRTADKRTALVTYLEPSQVGEGRVVLMRGHANAAKARTADDVAHSIDVTEHPDLPGLYLAADVLVTDYSSVMFDFAVTGKPMVFLAPDLAHYRDSTRGFYFDFEQRAPGPIVDSTAALAAVLDDLPTVVEQYAERYATFVNAFAAHDDGHATERVVDDVMGLIERQ